MNIFDAIQICALESVCNAQLDGENKLKHPDSAYEFRRITRWYSEHFHTALDYVREHISYEDVLQDYYEARFELMEEEQIELVMREAVKTPEQREKERREGDSEDAADLEFLKRAPELERKRHERIAQRRAARISKVKAATMPNGIEGDAQIVPLDQEALKRASQAREVNMPDMTNEKKFMSDEAKVALIDEVLRREQKCLRR